MSKVPDAKTVIGFVLGFWLSLALAEGPLHALVGLEAGLFDRVNRVRHEHHLIPLVGSSKLSRVARSHAEDMAAHDYLSHTDAGGGSPLDRVQAAGIEGFRLLAENIAASDVEGDRVSAVLERWLASEVHRKNLLHPGFNTTGIGSCETQEGRTIVVQLYASFPHDP